MPGSGRMSCAYTSPGARPETNVFEHKFWLVAPLAIRRSVGPPATKNTAMTIAAPANAQTQTRLMPLHLSFAPNVLYMSKAHISVLGFGDKVRQWQDTGKHLIRNAENRRKP